MATIKFYPNLKSGRCKVYLRMSLKRGKDFRVSTGQTIEDATSWSYDSGLPKKNVAENKALRTALIDLESHIEQELLKIERSQTENINDLTNSWLKNLVASFFNNKPREDKEELVVYAEYYHGDLKSRSYQRNGKKKKFSQNTIDKYENLAKLLKEYQVFSKNRFLIYDVDCEFADGFMTYLSEDRNMAINTIGRELKRLKTIVKDAEVKGMRVNINYRQIQGFEDETIVTYLTLDEIETIIEKPMPNEKLAIAKDWLVIGCFTGQRISDLYRMDISMVIKDDEFRYVTFKQYKTEKPVKVPLSQEVEDVLNKYDFNFPPNLHKNEKSNRSALSSLMKDVCEIAGINQKVIGRFNGVKGEYPKYKLIQNHSCRRSFASNFYGMEGWSNQAIMEITGHETEKNFLKYIDKSSFMFSEQVARNFEKMKIEKLAKKQELRVV